MNDNDNNNIYIVAREWLLPDNGTQVNVLGVYTDRGVAEDEASKAARLGGQDMDRGYIILTRYELNPKHIRTVNDAGHRLDLMLGGE
jgi:hypothetical protein